MAKDGRDILEVLQGELAFIKNRGYVPSVRQSWFSKSIFQDSMTCLNYGYPYRAHPCSECHLLDFVDPENRSQVVPCHHIPLNSAGDTIEELESQGDDVRAIKLVEEWLCRKINQIGTERTATFWRNVD
jgi:hypothetical protein